MSDRTALSRRTLLLALPALAAASCGGEPARETRQPMPAPPAAPGPAAPEPATGPVVTVLGDSITAGLGLPVAEALPAQLQAALNRRGVAARVRGAGVSGDTSAGGLARLDFSVQDDTAVCVLALGGNDLLQGIEPARLRANIDAAVQRLQTRGIRVVLAGLRPPLGASGNYGREFASAFSSVAEARDVAGFVPNLLEGVGAPLRQADGLHPNAEGVRIMAERLAFEVARALAAA